MKHFSTKTFITSIVAASLSAVSISAASDEDNEQLLEQTLVVASRNEISQKELSSSVSILNAEQLENLGYPDLSSALATLPSVYIANNGGIGKTTSVSVRGEAGFRTLVLLDGMDIADPSAPQTSAQMEHLLSSGISRVEVLRGPHGLSYGADAGGVILVNTGGEVNDGFKGSLNAEGGSYGTSSYGANLAYGNETVDFYMLGTSFNTDGFNASTADTVLADDDGYENTSAHIRLGVNLNESLRAEAVLRDVDGSTEYDGCYSTVPTDDCESDYAQTSYRFSLLHKGERFSNAIAYSTTDIDRDYFSDGVFSFGLKGSISKTEYLGTATLSDEHKLVYGLDEKTEEQPGTGLNRDQLGMHLEYQGSWQDKFFLNFGARRDDNDDFGKHNSLRLGAAWLFASNSKGDFKLKASHGTGFRAPSMGELSNNTDWGDADTPALKEETSRGADIGLEFFAHDGLHLALIYFQQEVTDEIFYAFPNYLQENGTSESSGVEIVADIPLNEHWAYYFNYSYTDSENSDGTVRSRQPKNKANLGLRANLFEERLSLGVHIRTAKDTYDSFSDTQMDDYSVVDANLRYTIIESVKVFLRLENLLDKEYESVPGFNSAEASGYAGLTFSF